MEAAFASSAASERFERFQCVISTGIGAFREHPCALTAIAVCFHDESPCAQRAVSILIPQDGL
jgi:hypothetical protein